MENIFVRKYDFAPGDYTSIFQKSLHFFSFSLLKIIFSSE